MERLPASHIVEYLSANLISDTLFEFRRGRSTEVQLLLAYFSIT